MDHFEECLSTQTVFEGKVFRVTQDEVRLENGATALREIVHHNGGACVAALTDDRKVLVVRQFRYAYGQELLELPAGKLEKGEDPFDAARRELAEEAGVTAEEYIDLGKYYPTCGYCGEVIHLYGARGLHFVGQHLDPDEFATPDTVDLDELCEKCLSGEVRDGKTIAGALRLRHALENGSF